LVHVKLRRSCAHISEYGQNSVVSSSQCLLNNTPSTNIHVVSLIAAAFVRAILALTKSAPSGPFAQYERYSNCWGVSPACLAHTFVTLANVIWN